MNIEIANRLVNLRKEKGLSQEQLAEKIGVSRQAVSKWERSEASPDTDNLIMLARLYEISLDELLRTSDEIPSPEPEPEKAETAPEPEPFAAENDGEGHEKAPEGSEVHIGSDGIHVNDGGEEVHVGPDGIHVSDGGEEVRVSWDGIHVSSGSDTFVIDGNGAFVNGEKFDWKERAKTALKVRFPIISICLILFFGVGFSEPNGLGWRVSWLFLLLIPVVNSLITAIKKHNPFRFLYPVLTVGIFFLTLLIYDPTDGYAWTVFLTIPLYYWICSLIRRAMRAEPPQDAKKPFAAFRPWLKRYSLVVDIVLLITGVIIAMLYGRVSIFGGSRLSALILLGIPVVQSLLRAVRDWDLRRVDFSAFTAAAFVLIYPYGFQGVRSYLWLLLIIPVYGMVVDIIAAIKEEKLKKENIR